jgi:hypothetical protein
MRMIVDADTYTGILQTMCYWNYVIDTEAWAGFDQVFTPDATLDLSRVVAHRDGSMTENTPTPTAGLPVCRGLDEIRELMSGRAHNPGAVHYATNLVLLGHHDGGIETYSRNMAVQPTGVWSQTAFYDLVIATEHGWRIRSRVSEPSFRLVWESFRIE